MFIQLKALIKLSYLYRRPQIIVSCYLILSGFQTDLIKKTLYCCIETNFSLCPHITYDLQLCSGKNFVPSCIKTHHVVRNTRLDTHSWSILLQNLYHQQTVICIVVTCKSSNLFELSNCMHEGFPIPPLTAAACSFCYIAFTTRFYRTFVYRKSLLVSVIIVTIYLSNFCVHHEKLKDVNFCECSSLNNIWPSA